MAIPSVNPTIRDPGLGAVPPNTGRAQVKIGASSKGTPNTVYSFGSPRAAADALQAGPLLDAVVQVLSVAGGPVLAVPAALPVGSFGTVTGGFAQSGTGSGTVTGSRGPEQAVKVRIILGGTLGTMTFQVRVGSGPWSPTVTSVNSPPWDYQVPGAYFTALRFAAGTYVAADEYTVNPDGTVVRTGSGPATALDASYHSPIDAYDIWVQIVTAGGLGAGAFKYSLDGGNNWSAPILIPSGGKYVIPASGIVLTFASTFVLGDIYKGTSSAAGFTTTEVGAAMTALVANPAKWGWVHVVGKTANAAAAATLAGVMDAHMTTAQTSKRFAFAVVECPQEEGDTAVKAAFVNFVSARVAVCVGDAGVVSPLTNRTDRRNCAWVFTQHLAKLAKLKDNPAAVKFGRVANVSSLYRDEEATPALDEARFVTMRSHTGKPGYYITNFKMMASPGSDFTYGMGRRVMDRTCEVANDGYLTFLGDDVRIDRTTGYIDERDALTIDGQVTAQLRAALLNEGEVSSVTATLSRTDNLLSTGVVNADVSAVPRGYMHQINVSLGFVNPALQVAA